jgi:glycosyltransferase involved in cell wall biosynthesis
LIIAVNTRNLLKGKLEGFGWYSYETLKRITQQHPEHQFIFFFDRPFDQEYVFSDNVTPIILSPPARHPILFKIWFNRSVTRALRKYKADIFVSPDGFLSLKTEVKQLAVIHDLNFKHYPEDLQARNAKYYNKYFPLFAQKATRILTVSHYSKADIVEQYSVSESKVDVAYNGAAEFFQPLSSDEQQAVKKQYAQGNDYFIYVGAIHPRKNVNRLLQAFESFREKAKQPVKLMIVGQKAWGNQEVETTFENMKFKDEVIFTGRLEALELNRVVASALAMTFVSYFEGFGIPIAEAFCAHTAVLTSDKTSLPEVAGDAALIVDPFSIPSIADAMEEIVSNETLRNDLIHKGSERAKLFNWQNSADGLWNSILKTIDS